MKTKETENCKFCSGLGYVYAFQDNNIPCPKCIGNKIKDRKMETLRSVQIKLEIDTNKRTIQEDFDCLEDFLGYIINNEFFDDAYETLQTFIGD